MSTGHFFDFAEEIEIFRDFSLLCVRLCGDSGGAQFGRFALVQRVSNRPQEGGKEIQCR
jgi:hypothetical protein